MSWFTDSNCEAQAASEHCAVAFATDFDFPSGHVRLGTWTGSLTFGGNTYTGAGGLVSVSAVSESMQIATEPWTYQLTGVDPAILLEADIDNSYGRSVVEYEVWLNPTTWQVIGYEINREGTIGKIRRQDGDSAFIEINVESRLIIVERADGWRYTTEHQEKFFSGDLGCDLVRQNDSIELIWGGKKVSPGTPRRNPRLGDEPT